MMDNLEGLPLDRICGLRPDLWLSVGNGYAREEVKALILSQGKGFVGDAVLTLQDLCLKITKLDRKLLLGSFSRQEILKMLLAEPKILSQIPEMKRLRRQRNFLKRLDQSLQQARVAFAHFQEEEVYEERLNSVLGENPLRKELSGFSKAYEAWLEHTGNVDYPLLLRRAIAVLQQGWPAEIAKPREIWSLSVQSGESLEKEFWDSVSHEVAVRQIQILDHTGGGTSAFSHPGLQSGGYLKQAPSWQCWHTLDDAAEALAEKLVQSRLLEELKDHAVIITDVPQIRRSLRRALEARAIPLADPRDPTRLRWEESVKWAILPLELVARNFERQKVISWLRQESVSESWSLWVKEIHSRGIRRGLSSYSGGELKEVHSQLCDLDQKFSGRKNGRELAKIHIEYLKSKIPFKSEYFWLIDFFETLWKELEEDLARIEQSDRKAPALVWFERLQLRLREAAPPVERLKPRVGVQIFRLQQAPLSPVKNIWIFGLPARWLDAQGTGGYWFTDREREVLSAEFSVRSSFEVREERLKILSAWIAGATQTVFLDSSYDAEGREKESLRPIFKELALRLQQSFPESAEEMGAHSRFLKSFGVLRPIPPQEVLLPSFAGFDRLESKASPLEMSATVVDRYSRCPFQSLAYHRWNLSDVREPDTELWPDVRGNLLHEAVRILMKSLNEDYTFTLSPKEALDQVWSPRACQGLIRSKRVEAYVKARLCLVLEAFLEKEKQVLERAGTHPMSLDQQRFRLEYPGFWIVGKPDRIDQHADGVFIMDYKTSGGVPHGVDMLEQGYRLQLPFYALAVQKQLNQPVLGLQFIELDRKAGRKSGIFFKNYNGKGPGCLTQVRSNSKSLIASDPQEVWDCFEKEVYQDALGYLEGRYPAKPKIENPEKECSRCRLADLCGHKRRISDAFSSGNPRTEVQGEDGSFGEKA